MNNFNNDTINKRKSLFVHEKNVCTTYMVYIFEHQSIGLKIHVTCVHFIHLYLFLFKKIHVTIPKLK